jgi:hypothetical protein
LQCSGSLVMRTTLLLMGSCSDSILGALRGGSSTAFLNSFNMSNICNAHWGSSVNNE